MRKDPPYTIKIDIQDDGTIEVCMSGDQPLDLRGSRNWSPAQRTAAEIYIGLGIPKDALEDAVPEGHA